MCTRTVCVVRIRRGLHTQSRADPTALKPYNILRCINCYCQWPTTRHPRIVARHQEPGTEHQAHRAVRLDVSICSTRHNSLVWLITKKPEAHHFAVPLLNTSFPSVIRLESSYSNYYRYTLLYLECVRQGRLSACAGLKRQ